MTAHDRRQKLIEMSETESFLLSNEDKYDRICFLRELEAARMISNNKRYSDMARDDKVSQKRFSVPKTVYKNWMSD